MDLTYNPGELDNKNVHKESVSGMKRDHESVDDFEHLDPESSPVDILSKPLVEVDSKSNNITATPLKTDFSDPLIKNEEISKLEDSSIGKNNGFFTNGKDTLSDNNFESQKSKENVELKTSLADFEIDSSLSKPGSTVEDIALNSDFISAEKAINSVKTESESDLLDLEENAKNDDAIYNDSSKSVKDDNFAPTKSMKEADAMSHYEIKLDKKEITKKDDNLEDGKPVGVDSFVISEPPKEQVNIENVLKDEPLDVHTPYKELISLSPSKTDAESHQAIDKRDDNNHKQDQNEIRNEKVSPISPESELTGPKPDVVKSQTAEEQVKERSKVDEESKDFPSADDITQHRVCICPSKPESAVSDLDDIIGPEDVFKRIGLVEALVYWRDPKKSGVVFGGVMAILLSLCYMSLISVVAYSSLLALIGTICFRIYKNILQAVQKTSEGHPFKEFLELELSLPQDKVREMTDTAVVHINAALVELRRLFLVEDLIDSIKFAVCLWCLTYVGAVFNGMTLVILGFVALFTVPKIYENNKASIDTYIEMGRSKVAEITSKVKAAVPIGKKEPEKDKEQ